MVFKGVLDAWFNSFNYRTIVETTSGDTYDGVLGKISQHSYIVVIEDGPAYILRPNSIISIEITRGTKAVKMDGVMIITCDERRDKVPSSMKYDF